MKIISSKPKIQRSYTNHSLCWLIPVFQTSTSISITYYLYIKFSSMGHTFYSRSISFGTYSKLNKIIKIYIRLALVLCIWSSKCYKNLSLRLKKSELQSYKKVGTILTRYFITRASLIDQKLTILSSSIGITIMLL